MPAGELLLAADGNFYGTSQAGGVNDHGTIFKMTPSGTLTALREFSGLGNATKGDAPAGGLVRGTDGDFYGVTESGGARMKDRVVLGGRDRAAG